MAAAAVEEGGFNFDLCKRNAHLLTKGVEGPAPHKTGTTICGLVFKVIHSLNRRTCLAAGCVAVLVRDDACMLHCKV